MCLHNQIFCFLLGKYPNIERSVTIADSDAGFGGLQGTV